MIDIYRVLKEAAEQQQPVALATVVAAPPGRAVTVRNRMVVYPDRTTEGSLGNQALDDHVAHDALALMQKGVSRTFEYRLGDAPEATRVAVYIDLLVPPPRLLVCGAGHDAIPVARLAKALGWWVVVVDSRAKFATKDRFPEADDVVLAHSEEVAAKIPIDANTYAVVMTHNYLHDKAILKGLLPTPAQYIGMLGPRKRTEAILADILKDGIQVSEEQLRRIHGPVGLDIGADTPEEIALAILGEVLALRSGRSGMPLRLRKGPIHAPSESRP